MRHSKRKIAEKTKIKTKKVLRKNEPAMRVGPGASPNAADATKAEAGMRDSGIRIVGDVPWGSHFCQFYQTKKDLLDVLVPYFKAGLENNEFCMWVTAEPLSSEEAEEALGKAVPDLEGYFRRGQIEIIPYSDWYKIGGRFEEKRVLDGWVSKLDKALAKGFDGLRLTGNTFWLEKKEWKAFADYEEAVNGVIGKYRMIAVCTYSLEKCGAAEIMDVVKNHEFALVLHEGRWQKIESHSSVKQLANGLRKSEERFASLFSAMTEGVAIHDVIYDGRGRPVDYVISDVNPAYEKITGMSRAEAVGKRASELYGTGKPPYLDIYARTASKGGPVSFESYFPPMDKHFSISVFSAAEGSFTTVFRDITISKRSEEEMLRAKEEWERTFDSVPDLIAILDGKHRIIRTNKAMAERLKITPDKCVGLSCFSCVHGTAGPIEGCPHTLTLADGKEHVAEVHEERLGGDFLVSTTPLKDKEGKVLGTVHVARDITERKKIEDDILRHADKLRASNEELERFNRAMVDREIRMIELKREVNELCAKSGLPQRYPMNFPDGKQTA